MRILGIETSCDETAAAIIDVSGSTVRPRVRVLSNVVASQVKLHAKYGGVVPHLAKREHQRNLVPVLSMALRESRIQNLESRSKTVHKILNSKLQIMDSILEREPELFARMVPKVTALPPPKIDAIAVTVGPGLAPALWVGVNFARALSYLWRKPLVAVDHLEGHIYTNLIPQIREVKSPASAKATAGKQKSKVKGTERSRREPPNLLPFTFHLLPLTFPALCLIVSGGHTELVLMRRSGDYHVIGETLDDAAGEAFDKVARMMGLGFPGGPEIAAEAARMQNVKFKMQNDKVKLKIKLPRPMLHSKDYNFSFSGLKTAVLYLLRDLQGEHSLQKIRSPVAEEFQNAVVDVLVAKTVRAATQYRVKTVMIGGGVAANRKLRHDLGQALATQYPSAHYLLPDPSLTGDNALMIALAGYFNRKKKTAWRSLQADANLRLDD